MIFFKMQAQATQTNQQVAVQKISDQIKEPHTHQDQHQNHSPHHLIHQSKTSNTTFTNIFTYAILFVLLLPLSIITFQFMWTIFWGIIFPGSLWTFGIIVGGIRSIIHLSNQYNIDCSQMCNQVYFRPFSLPIAFYFPLTSKLGRVLKRLFYIHQ